MLAGGGVGGKAGDGVVYNPHAISAEGFSDDAPLRKATEEAVMQWRFQTGTMNGKDFQTTTTVDLIFSQPVAGELAGPD